MSQVAEIEKKIIKFLEQQEWPVTTEQVAKALNVSWQTAQINLLKLAAEGKVKYKKVGRQNQWILVSWFKKLKQS
jgi:Mn-dependent DtxR family transcriptional regulator